MGSRYGRNQRRKHREQIAELGYQYDRAEVTANRERARAARLEQELTDWNDEIIRLLGPDTAFQRHIQTHHLRDVRDFRRRPMPSDLRAAARMAILEPSAPDSRTVEIILMQKLRVWINQHDHQLRKIIALELEDTHHQSRYAISDDLWMQSGLGSREIHYVAERIARELIDLLNKNRHRKPGQPAQQ